jgi:MFS family permease
VFTPAPAHGRHAHYLFAAALFAILGFHVGVWAVQLAPLSAGLRLDPAALGAAVTVAASAGLVTLFAGGALADLADRRPVLVIGFAGTGTAFVLMALAGRFATLLPGMLLYGLSVSFIDLGANTVGSAYEQAYKVTAMTGLHAWFSGGALAGAIGSAAALRAGVGRRSWRDGCETHRGPGWRGGWEAYRGGAGQRPCCWPAFAGLGWVRAPGPPRTPGDRGQEAREPGAGRRKTRLRAMSSTGAGSPLRMASRRESLPDR